MSPIKLDGAVDLHVHSYPCVYQRRVDDRQTQLGGQLGRLIEAAAQTAQTGASSTVRQASSTARAVRPWPSYLHPLGAAPEALE